MQIKLFTHTEREHKHTMENLKVIQTVFHEKFFLDY